MKNDKVYICHILECIDDVERYLSDDKERFMQDGMTRDAVLRKLQIMVESTQRLSARAKNAMPQIRWQDISDFRNVLVHGYLGDIDLDIIWQAIEHRLPELKTTLESYNSGDS